MFFTKKIGQSGYRDFDEIIQAHDRVYSDDPKTSELGCEQIFSWLAKNSRNQPFFEVTAVIRNSLLNESKVGLSNGQLNQLYQSLKFFCSRSINEFTSKNKYYQIFLKYSHNEFNLPPKDELIEFSNFLFTYLDKNYWIPKIKDHQQQTANFFKIISEYFENENTFSVSYNNFLLYFVPILIKEFCKDWKEEVEDDDEIFGFTRQKLIQKFPKFISKAIDFTNEIFADSFALEFSDYLIKGSTWASKVLDILFEGELCNTHTISNYILCSPQRSQKIIDFFQKHSIQIDDPTDSFWYGTPMGIVPYLYDLNDYYDVESSLVGFLSEIRDNKKKPLNQNNNTNNNKNSNQRNSSNKNEDQNKPTPTLKQTKIPPNNVQLQDDNANQSHEKQQKPCKIEKPVKKEILIEIPKNKNQE